MGTDRKYLVAVALLATLAVVFGLAGTVTPGSELVSPQELSSSSDSVTHFMNPPTYDSSWTDITDKRGQFFNVTHDLNTTEALVDVVGRQSLTGGDHKLFLGTTIYIEELNQTYGGTSPDYARSMILTSDGGYALAGYTSSFGAGSTDFWLVKTDNLGNKQWSKPYGGTGYDAAYSVVQTSDGGYALAGYTNSSGAGSYDFWLVKTDSAGNMVWSQTYGGADWDRAFSVVQTVDGGYALAGCTYSFGVGGSDFWLVKTDSAGNHLWNRTYGGGPDAEEAYSLVQTIDFGYAIAGYTNSFGVWHSDFWLVKTDSAGYPQWGRTYGGTGYDAAYSVVQTSDGGYALAGWTDSFGAGQSDFWLVKTNWDGIHLWNRTYGGPYADECYSVVQTGIGGYALAGYTYSYGADGPDFWLAKTEVGQLGFSFGLSMTNSTSSTITFYRGSADPFWNYMRVRIWLIKEPTWMFGDINQDGIVDVKDLAILSKNYGKTFSALSLTGIIAVMGVYTYKKRKNQPT